MGGGWGWGAGWRKPPINSACRQPFLLHPPGAGIQSQRIPGGQATGRGAACGCAALPIAGERLDVVVGGPAGLCQCLPPTLLRHRPVQLTDAVELLVRLREVERDHRVILQGTFNSMHEREKLREFRSQIFGMMMFGGSEERAERMCDDGIIRFLRGA